MSATLSIRCRFSESRYEWSYEGGSVLNTTFVDDYFRLLAYSRCKDSKKTVSDSRCDINATSERTNSAK